MCFAARVMVTGGAVELWWQSARTAPARVPAAYLHLPIAVAEATKVSAPLALVVRVSWAALFSRRRRRKPKRSRSWRSPFSGSRKQEASSRRWLPPSPWHQSARLLAAEGASVIVSRLPSTGSFHFDVLTYPFSMLGAHHLQIEPFLKAVLGPSYPPEEICAC